MAMRPRAHLRPVPGELGYWLSVEDSVVFGLMELGSQAPDLIKTVDDLEEFVWIWRHTGRSIEQSLARMRAERAEVEQVNMSLSEKLAKMTEERKIDREALRRLGERSMFVRTRLEPADADYVKRAAAGVILQHQTWRDVSSHLVLRHPAIAVLRCMEPTSDGTIHLASTSLWTRVLVAALFESGMIAESVFDALWLAPWVHMGHEGLLARAVGFTKYRPDHADNAIIPKLEWDALLDKIDAAQESTAVAAAVAENNKVENMHMSGSTDARVDIVDAGKPKTSARMRKTMREQGHLLGAAAGEGLAMGAVNQVGELLVSAVRVLLVELVGQQPAIDTFLATPKGREAVKVLGALLAHTAASEMPGFIPDGVAAASRVQLKYSVANISSDTLAKVMPFLAKIGEIGSKLPPSLMEGGPTFSVEREAAKVAVAVPTPASTP